MSRRLPHRDALGALALWTFSLQGLLLGVLLTILKYRADTFCDDDTLGTCPLGQTTACTTVLTDTWATVLGLPLTVYSAALHLVVAALALWLVLGRHHRRAARPVLLLLAWAGLLVSAALAAYAWFGLRALCPYCLFLYGVQLGIFVAARLMNPGGLRHVLRPLLTPRALVVGGLAALALVTVVSVQRTLLARAARAHAENDLSPCEVGLSQVPASPLTLAGDVPPRLIAAVFLDLACPHCRAEFEFWPAFQKTAPWPIEVRFYHYPATSCTADDLAAGAADLSLHRSCDAARALHCLVEHDPARGLEIARTLFAAQSRPAPHFSAEHLAGVAREFGLAADAGRLAADDPLFRCMADPATTAALVRDVEFAEHVAELDRPPGALLIPLRDGRPFGRARQVRGHKPQATLEAWIADLLADLPEPE